MIVFYKRLEADPSQAAEDGTQSRRPFVARASHVFNVAQVDGFEPDTPKLASQFQRIAEVEAFVSAVKADIQHGFTSARYRPDTDIIELPEREWFAATETGPAEVNYYAILLHELTHWSGATHRLGREFGKRFGDEAYAFEELVAELGAAFMCAVFRISTEPRPDHAAYVSSWLKVLNRDPKAIFTAASKAQEAFSYLAYLAEKNV
jgi:antirestriction protein ArdC